jgi:hypothetical protein
MSRADHVGTKVKPENNVYRIARGDELLQDRVFAPDAIRRGLGYLAEYGVEGGFAELAYSPEMAHRFEEILQRRYETTDGPEIFEMPNTAPYDDAAVARFYGCDTADTGMIRSRRETFDEATTRLLRETARELAPEMLALQTNMATFEVESWARYGPYDPIPLVHADPDVTLLRNPGGGWGSIDLPQATSQKTNVIEYTDGVPHYTFAAAHEGWLVDRENGFWDTLATDDKPARGFY